MTIRDLAPKGAAQPASVTIVIPGEPVAKGRPRMTRNGHTFTPERTTRYENLVKLCGAEARRGRRMLQGPLEMKIVATWALPKTQHRKGTPRCAEWRTKRPDADNVAKCVCDALNGVVYDDDSQIVWLSVQKRQAAQCEEPGVIVVIRELKGDR
jgi:Holliday junction resolvase RusA-like endonuclease